MSHELTTREDGTVEFAYLQSDGAPWHGLGQAMEPGASIDSWRTAAGMDWRIQRSKVRYAIAHGQDADSMLELPDQHVLFRSDNKHPLGVVSSRYQVVQPAEVLEFFRGVARAGGLEMSAAGTIYDGRRFWATAKIGEASPLSVRDRIGGYLLLSTSADGSLATEARLTSIRVVCKNTLQMARADGKPALRVSHRSVFDAKSVQAQMGLNHAAWDAFRANIVRLANVELHEEHAATITAGLFATAPGTDGQDKARETAGFKKVMALFNGGGMGAQLDGVFGTAWGLVNAVTEYADHHVRARSDEHRFVSSQWGGGADLKQRAWDELLALA